MKTSRIGVAAAAAAAVVAAVSAPTVLRLVPGQGDDTGCPGTEHDTIVDWTRFLRFDGRTYEGAAFEAPERVERSRVGAEVGRVTCHLSSHSDADRPVTSLPDGTAPFLRVGTSIHRLAGHPVECRVAVAEDGGFTVYVAQREVNGRSVPACPEEEG